jgi:hypothetical protein
MREGTSMRFQLLSVNAMISETIDTSPAHWKEM